MAEIEQRELEPWEKKFYGVIFDRQIIEHNRLLRDAEKLELRNWRGRRLRACRAADDLYEIIAALGVEEDSSVLPPPDARLPTPPTEAMKREMQNTAANLLRMILLWNDGSVSPQKLQRF